MENVCHCAPLVHLEAKEERIFHGVQIVYRCKRKNLSCELKMIRVLKTKTKNCSMWGHI